MSAAILARFFDELYRTGRASAGPPIRSIGDADPDLAALDAVLVGRVAWHVRGLPGDAAIPADTATARACASALYALLVEAVEPTADGAAAAVADAVPAARDPSSSATLDALLLDAPRMLRRLETADAASGTRPGQPSLAATLKRLVEKSPMTRLRYCGSVFPPPADLGAIVGSRSLCEEAVALLGIPGNDADRLAALGKALEALLGQGGEQTRLALRAYEVFSFFCARIAGRPPAGGERHEVDLAALAEGRPGSAAVAAYLRPLGVVAESPRLADLLREHPRLDPALLKAANLTAARVGD